MNWLRSSHTIGVALVASLLAACDGGSATAGSQSGGHGNVSNGNATSTNWSGYVTTGPLSTFSQVSGSWEVPTVNCASGSNTGSATWVGIGGYATTDPTLIQAGTGQDCSGGASYYAWWEIFPVPSINLNTSNYPVQPGDRITVTIDGSAVVTWTITINNSRANWTFTTSAPFAGARQSAEWIEEAQLQAGTGHVGQANLSDFARVTFSEITANGVNPALTSAEALVMVDSNNQPIATPSAPRGGNAFDICRGLQC